MTNDGEGEWGEVHSSLESPGRRKFLETAGSAGLAALAGCGSNGDGGDGYGGGTTATTTQEETPAETTTEPGTTTERTTTTPEGTINGFQVQDKGALKDVEPVHIVTPENQDDMVNVNAAIDYEGEPRAVGLYFWNIDSEEEQTLYEGPLPENPENFSIQLPRQFIGPWKNTLQCAFLDEEGGKSETAEEVSRPGNFGYKWDVHDHHGTLPAKTGTYSDEIEHTARTWDNIHTEISEQRWEEMYWNDIDYEKGGHTSGFSFQNAKEKVDEMVNDSDDPAEKVYKMVKGIDHEMPATENVGSGGAATLFYTAERYIARDVLEWGMEDHHVIWMPVAYSHEVIPTGFKDKNDDWQIRWHRPTAIDTYGKPENTELRDEYPEHGTIIDGLNYSKLHKHAAAGSGLGGPTTRDVHRLPAGSLLLMAETRAAEDVLQEAHGYADLVAFTRDQLKEMEENILNGNFRPDKYRKPGRAIWEIGIDDKTSDDHVGVSLDAEDLYNLTVEQYYDTVNSFDYDPFSEENKDTPWSEAGPENPVNDFSKLISGAA